MMKKVSISLLSLLILTLVGCDQDPYPVEQEIRRTPRSTPQDTLPPLAIEPIEDIKFREGLLSEFKIRVAVEEPGEPILKAEGLPEGATFDENTFTISWKPGYFDANDPNNPTVKRRTYPVTLRLFSTAMDLNNDGVSREVKLVVEDSPRPITLDTRSVTPEVDENEEFSRIIRFKNEDFPNGPFKVATENLPSSLEIEEVDGTTFRLKFRPDYFHVNRDTVGRNYIRYEGKIVASNPRNETREFKYRIQVNDVRQGVKLVAPEEIEQGLDAGFQVAAYDLNREIAPNISLSVKRPAFGKFITSIKENPKTFSSVLSILWKDIPPRYNKTTQKVTYEACVLDSRGQKTDCQEQSTKIKIELKDRTPPIISRKDWPVGELVYLNFNKTLSRDLPVRDAEDSQLTPKVEIFPEEMREFVRFKRGNGRWDSSDRLEMKFNKPGTFQFNVVATSDYNVSSAESFLVEVFPENRNKVLIFADSTRDKEVLFYKEQFKQEMDLMNPAIQVVNQRNISGRETVILTTSTLLDDSNKNEIFNAIEEIDHVVIASALYERLPEKFLTRLQEDYDLRAIGRYSQLPNLPPLEKMRFQTTGQFQASINDIGLKGSTTTESADPLIFNGGLDEPDKVCKGVLGLTETGNNPLRIGVNCRRKNGGRISILGTEWADLKVTEEDSGIVESWFNTLLNAKF